MNLCNIYSQKSDHYTALFNGLKAIKTLKEKNSETAVLAYQGIGAEYEFLGMKKEAKEMYFNGFMINKSLPKKNHYLSIDLQNAYNRLKQDTEERRSSPLSVRKHMKQYNFQRNHTPEIPKSDRLLTDFISAPVNFEELIKATIYSPLSKVKSNARSITPISRDLKTHKLVREICNTPTLKRLKNSKSIRKKSLVLDKLIPVPKKSKLSLNTGRMKNVTNRNYY